MTIKQLHNYLLLSFFVFSGILSNALSQTLELDSTWWFTNGKVNTILKDSINNQIFIGGAFSYIGPKVDNGCILNSSTTQPFNSNINGLVKVAIPDGSDGWYIGGDFTMIGDSVRERIAHLDEFGNVTNNLSGISCNETVKSLAISGDKLIVGGEFLHCGKKQSYGAELSTSSEIPSTVIPKTNSFIRCSLSDGNGGWFIGGDFSMVGDSVRNGFAYILSNGMISPAIFSFTGSLRTIVRSNDTLIIGGSFSEIDGISRNNIAMIDFSSNQLLSWNPNVNGPVNTIEIAFGKILIGGTFSAVDGQSRNNFATFYQNTGILSSLDLNLNGEVRCIKSSNTNIYLGGSFTSALGQTRNRILTINGITEILSNWNPNSNNTIYDMILRNGQLYVGGAFTNIGGQNQGKFATLDTLTGLLINNGLYGNGTVFKLHLTGDTLYVGGDFNQFKNVSRYDIAAVNLTTNSVLPWSPISDATVGAISTFGNKVFLGGSFTIIGNPNSVNLVAIDKYTGQSTNWNIATNLGTNNSVNSLLINQGRLFVGGVFTNLGGQPRNNIGVIDTLTGNVLSSALNVTGLVYALSANNTNLYIGGAIFQINGQSRNHIGAVDLNTLALTSWNPNANYPVNTLESNNTTVFVGGEFTNIGGSTRNYLASINVSTGVATSWNPNAQNSVSGENAYINALKLLNDTLYVGGGFNLISSMGRKKNAAYNIITGTLIDWTAHCNGNIYTIAKNNGQIFIGGSYSSINGYIRNSLACVSTITGKATPWNPDLGNDGEAKNLIHYGNKIYVVGNFTQIGGQARFDVGSIDALTGLVENWNPNPSSVGGFILSSAVANNFLIVGGEFTAIGGQNRNNLASIDLTNASIGPWNPGANNDVFCLFPDVATNTIYVGGQFTNLGGQSRNRIGALDLTTGNTLSFNPNVNNDVYSIQKLGSSIYFSGNFLNVNGIPRNRIASVDGSTGVVNSFNSNNDLWPYISILFKLVIKENILYAVGDENKMLKYDLVNDISSNYIIPDTYYAFTIEVDNSRIYIGNWSDSGFSPYTTCDITYSQISEVVCDSFSLAGTTYYSSGFYQQVLFNSTGCDSVVTLNLTILPSSSSIDFITACDSLTWIDGITYYSSTSLPTWILQNSDGCDSVIVLNLTILPSSESIDFITACDSLSWIDGITYYSSTSLPTWTLQNSNGCDSLITLDLTIIEGFPTIVENVFSLPSSDLICNGSFAVEISGNPDFELTTNSETQITSGYSLFSNICPGIHDLQILNSCGDTLNVPYVVPLDTNYVFINPFIDSLAQDSLGVILSNCEIYYNSIDTAFIDSIWSVANTVNVIWNIVDANGSNYDTTSYILNEGFGVYWLQLSVFCPTKLVEDYFTVTEAVYFGDGYISTAALSDNEISDVQIFPNPTNDSVEILFEGKEADLKIYDAQGKLLYQSAIISNHLVDLSEFETGVYFAQLTVNNMKQTIVKILKF